MVPSDYKQQRNEATKPVAQLDISYVHGYRCHDVRNNIRYTNNDQLVYHTAALGIVLNTTVPGQYQQRYFNEHNDDISCIDICDNLVVTGQVGMNPLICVWDAETQETQITFAGILKKGIGQVSICSENKRIAATGLDEDHTLVIYDYQKAIEAKLNPNKKNLNDGLIATCKLTKAAVFDLKFDPQGTHTLRSPRLLSPAAPPSRPLLPAPPARERGAASVRALSSCSDSAVHLPSPQASL